MEVFCRPPLNFPAFWRRRGSFLDLRVLWMLAHITSLVWLSQRRQCIPSDLIGDVSYSRKYGTKHHFRLRLRRFFLACFIVHRRGLLKHIQLAGTGDSGLKGTLFLLGDLLNTG